MSFSVWFKNWIRAFCKLLTFDYKKPKSDSQRRRERERRLKAKHSSANFYRTKKKYKRRRSSMAVQNEKLFNGLFGFIGASLGILLLPFGLFDWGRKSIKAKRTSRGSSLTKRITPKHATISSVSQQKKTPTKTDRKTLVQTSHMTIKPQETHTSTGSMKTTSTTPIRLFEFPESKMTAPLAETTIMAEPDENTPKSTPQNEKDQYIRKRMIIAGSYYCDKAVLDTLEVGSRIDLEVEPDNPYDKDAVKLLFNGQKIGYIVKKDHMAFVTCLKLNQKIYGVITAIIDENGRIKYEFETWFDSVR